MSLYQFKTRQFIEASLQEVWDFISSPANLKVITPDYMGFDIMSRDLPAKMYPGMIIEYKVSPLLGIKTSWVTEITHVVENEFFVDEQRVGPYLIWHHQHHIREQNNGVMMSDIVSYQPPFGFLGDLANTVIIRKKLKEIFDYRRMALDHHFNGSHSTPESRIKENSELHIVN